MPQLGLGSTPLVLHGPQGESDWVRWSASEALPDAEIADTFQCEYQNSWLHCCGLLRWPQYYAFKERGYKTIRAKTHDTLYESHKADKPANSNTIAILYEN
eukprot:1309190-Amphidinium_carterae.1